MIKEELLIYFNKRKKKKKAQKKSSEEPAKTECPTAQHGGKKRLIGTVANGHLKKHLHTDAGRNFCSFSSFKILIEIGRYY